jgi:perosamine synthetase
MISYFHKGRVALHAALAACGVGPGDAVALQGFTCVVVASAIKYLGATPVYVDINPQTLTADLDELTSCVTSHPRLKAIIAQNSFGLSEDIDAVLSIARPRGIMVIEDAAHGLGSRYREHPAGSRADAAIFSSQWSKPITTGLGGWLVVNNKELESQVRSLLPQYASHSRSGEVMESLLFSAYRIAMRPSLYWPLIESYRWMSGKGLLPGSSSGEELDGVCEPAGYKSRLRPSAVRRIESASIDYTEIVDRRRYHAQLYNDALIMNGSDSLVVPAYAHHSYLRFPLLCDNRDAFILEAQRQRLEVGDWFNSPLHPVQDRLDRWDYIQGQCPNAEWASQRIVNLPTHGALRQQDVDNAIALIGRFRLTPPDSEVPRRKSALASQTDAA